MSWGDTLSNAWNSATDVARSAAEKVGSTAQSAYDWTREKVVQGAEYARDKAVQGIDYTRDKVVQGYEYARDKAHQAYDGAKEWTRDGERRVADAVYDGASSVVEGGRRIYKKASNAASNAYDKARSMLGLGPAGSPVAPCPMAQAASKKVDPAKIDGWVMSPQGSNPDGTLKDCIAVPPGSKALAAAKQTSVQSESACCKARKARGEQPRDIIYVNGISTDAETHCDTLRQIAEQTCARVVGVYNATEGLADAAQTGQDRRLIKAAASGKPVPTQDGRNPAVDSLARTIADEVEAGRKPEIWAHSQGGAVTSLALYEANNDLAVTTGQRNPLAGVKVKSFGSAAPQWVDGPTYEHYVNVNDPVPTMFGLGHDGGKDSKLAGAGAKVIRFGGDVEDAAPFQLQKPSKEWLPTNISNHSVGKSYLRMEKQVNGGC